MITETQKLLLHVCCGPCASGCVDRLPEGLEPILFYSNSNIATRDEYDRRLAEVHKLAALTGRRLIVDDYDHSAWLEAVAGLEGEPEGGKRCHRCFRFNLGRAAHKAVELGCPTFTTTLTVSPRKNSALVFEAGRESGPFLELNFKKKDGFAHSLAMSRHYDMYRQPSCGCEFAPASPVLS